MRDKTPVTEATAKKRFGRNFLDSTCSVLCKKCRTPNFFCGPMWCEAVPERFVCVECNEDVCVSV